MLPRPQELYVWRARLDTSIVRCSGAVAATRLMLEQEVLLLDKQNSAYA